NQGTIISINGTQVCKLKLTQYSSGYGFTTNSVGMGTFTLQSSVFPIQTPDAPAGTGAYNTGVVLKKGDKLTFQASGGWGSTKQEELFNVLGGFFKGYTFTTSCSDVLVTGMGTDDKGKSAAVNNPDNNQPSALYGSDGKEAFLLGAGVKDQLINNDGYLQIGYNVPMSSAYGCQVTKILALSVQRCQDAAGTSYPCP
ncbi:hypothetical protein WDW86_06375, partial [Bdellovibrionota bacterium FG-2]